MLKSVLGRRPQFSNGDWYTISSPQEGVCGFVSYHNLNKTFITGL